MQAMNHELSVLAKAVHYKNLSAAAMHVGLSQPQLSRIIAKIEVELNVVVLDRSAKRKSGWTSVAFKLAELFERSNQRLSSELMAITNNEMISELHIGTLEGLSKIAIETARVCFENIGVQRISLDIYDLSELEANFLAGHLDIIFTAKSPGRQKFNHIIEIGYQLLEKVNSDDRFAVLSSFESGRIQKKELEKFDHILVSNSLSIRRDWFEIVGGTGLLPTEIRQGKTRENEPVYIIGSDLISPLVWTEIQRSIQNGPDNSTLKLKKQSQ